MSVQVNIPEGQITLEQDPVGDLEAATKAYVDANGGVKVYRALLTQTGTDAPVATVLENTLGGTVVWTYTGVGQYTGTLAGAFIANKTFGIISQRVSLPAEFAENSVDDVLIYTNSDGELGGNSLEILVYPA